MEWGEDPQTSPRQAQPLGGVARPKRPLPATGRTPGTGTAKATGLFRAFH